MKTRFLLLALASIALVVARTAALGRHNQKTGPEAVVEKMLAGERPPDLPLLREMGPRALPPLFKALSIGHPALERGYTMLAQWLPEPFTRPLPRLLRAQSRRLNAAAWVGHLGPAAKAAVPHLMKLLRDDIADGNAAYSLMLLGPEARAAVPALLVALREHRPYAATALAGIGTPEEVGPALEAASHSGPAWQRAEARTALRNLRALFAAYIALCAF